MVRNSGSVLCDMRDSDNPDVRRVQELLRNGGPILEVYKNMGFAEEYASQILKYLGYRDCHIYDEDILEFDEWKRLGEPLQ